MALLDFSQVASPVPLPRPRPADVPLPRERPAPPSDNGIDWSEVASPVPSVSVTSQVTLPTPRPQQSSDASAIDWSEVASPVAAVPAIGVLGVNAGVRQAAKAAPSAAAPPTLGGELSAAGSRVLSGVLDILKTNSNVFMGVDEEHPKGTPFGLQSGSENEKDLYKYGVFGDPNAPLGRNPLQVANEALIRGVVAPAADAVGRAIEAGGADLGEAFSQLVKGVNEVFKDPNAGGDPEAARNEMINLVNSVLIEIGMGRPHGEIPGRLAEETPAMAEKMGRAPGAPLSADPATATYLHTGQPPLPHSPEVQSFLEKAKATQPPVPGRGDAINAMARAYDKRLALPPPGYVAPPVPEVPNVPTPSAPPVAAAPVAPRPATPPPVEPARPGPAVARPQGPETPPPARPPVAPPAEGVSAPSVFRKGDRVWMNDPYFKGGATVIRDTGDSVEVRTDAGKGLAIWRGHLQWQGRPAEPTPARPPVAPAPEAAAEAAPPSVVVPPTAHPSYGQFLNGDKPILLTSRNELADEGINPAALKGYGSVNAFDLNGDPITTYWKPGQEAAAKEVGDLFSAARNRTISQSDFHRRLGQLLGYPAGDVEAFVRKNGSDKPFDIDPEAIRRAGAPPGAPRTAPVEVKTPEDALQPPEGHIVGEARATRADERRLHDDAKFTAIAKRTAPFASERGYGNTPVEAQRDALNRIKPIAGQKLPEPAIVTPEAIRPHNGAGIPAETSTGIPEKPAVPPVSEPVKPPVKSEQPVTNYHATAGEPHPVAEPAAVKAARENPAVMKYYDRPIRVDHTFDVPYLAGYSKDGHTIYIDRHLPSEVKINGKKTPIFQYLMIHERLEKALIDALGYKYQGAHEVATGAEHMALRQKMIDPAAYEKALRPFIKHDQHERLQKVPADLDMTPYDDTQARNIEARMQKAGTPPAEAPKPAKTPQVPPLPGMTQIGAKPKPLEGEIIPPSKGVAPISAPKTIQDRTPIYQKEGSVEERFAKGRYERARQDELRAGDTPTELIFGHPEGLPEQPHDPFLDLTKKSPYLEAEAARRAAAAKPSPPAAKPAAKPALPSIAAEKAMATSMGRPYTDWIAKIEDIDAHGEPDSAYRSILSAGSKETRADGRPKGAETWREKVLQGIRTSYERQAPQKPASAPEAPAAPQAPTKALSIRERIEDAYLAITHGRKDETVRLADLRAKLPDLNRATVDAGLRSILQGDETASLMRHDDPHQLTQRDRDAAFSPTGEPFHVIWISSKKRPLEAPAAPTPQAKPEAKPEAKPVAAPALSDARKAAMREIGKRMDAEYAKADNLRPPSGTVSVGSADFDHILKAETAREFLGALRKGKTPAEAEAHALTEMKAFIATHNKKAKGAQFPQDWKRYEGGDQTYVAHLRYMIERADEPAKPVAEAKAAPTPKPGASRRTQNLHQFLKAAGGIKDSTDNLRPLYPDLINNKTGRPLDDARLIAAEAGYLGGNTTDAMANTTVDDLLTALRNGRKTFPQTAEDMSRRAETDAAKQATKGKEQARHEIETAFAHGDIPHDADFLDRATRIYLVGGVTPEVAIDRAIGEIEREELTPAQVKRVRANLPPGWDDDLADTTEPSQSSQPLPQDGGRAGEPAQRRPVEETRGPAPGGGAAAVEAEKGREGAGAGAAARPVRLEGSFATRLRETANWTDTWATGLDAGSYRIKWAGNGYIVQRGDRNAPPTRFRPEDGKTWTIDEAIATAEAEAAGRLAPSEVEGSAEYRAAHAESDRALQAFTKVTEAYRNRTIGDAEFLAGRKIRDAAMAKFDAAFEKEQNRKPPKPKPPVEAGAEGKPQTVLPGAEAAAPAEAKAALKGERAQAEAKVRAQQSKMRKGGQKPVDEQKGGLFEEKSGDLFAGKKSSQTLLSSAEREANKPVFFSAALRAVENAKITKGTPKEWMDYLITPASKGWRTIRDPKTNKPTGKVEEYDIAAAPLPGVKQEELDWIGINDWLKAQTGSVTRDQVAEFVRANQIAVKEVLKAGDEDVRNPNLWAVEGSSNGKVWRIVDSEHGVPMAEETFSSREEARAWLAEQRNGYSPTKHSTYQLPGGENYRELLLTLPSEDSGVTIEPRGDKWAVRWAGGETLFDTRAKADIAAKNVQAARARSHGNRETYVSSHFPDDVNPVAHVRFNDRMAPLSGDPSGRMVKTLHIEEGQSDWHKAGRKQGYWIEPRYTVVSATGARVLKPGGQEVAVYDVKAEADAYAAQHEGWSVKETRGTGVPDAPFKTTWPELILKRMIRYAAEHGYEQISWSPGIVQVDRYTSELRQRVKSIAWDTTAAGKEVFAVPAGAQAHLSFTLDERGVIVKSSAMGAKDHPIEDIVGKEIARQILEQPGGSIEGEGLTIGGKGFTDLYDKQWVQIANKLGKKFGAKVGESKIGTEDPASIGYTGDETQAVIALPITPAMRASVMEGQPLFKRTPGNAPAVKVPPEARANLERALRNKVAQLIGAERAKAISFEPVIHAEGAGDPGYEADIARYVKLGGKIGPTAGGHVRIMPSGEALIRLATDDPKFSPMGSARHEPMHVAQAFLMTDEEVAALSTPEAVKAIGGLASEELNAAGRGEKLPPYEALAIGYERYDRMRDEGLSPAEIAKGIGGGIRGMLIRVFERLRKLLADIRKALTGSRGAWGRWQDVFQDFSEGKMAGREARQPVRDLTRGGDMALGETAEKDVPRSDYAELLNRAARGEETPPLTKAQARERKRAEKEFPVVQRIALDKTARQLAARAEEVAQMANGFAKALKASGYKTKGLVPASLRATKNVLDRGKLFNLSKRITAYQENVNHPQNQPALTPGEMNLYNDFYKPLFDLHNNIYHDIMAFKGHMDDDQRAAMEEMANPEYVHHVVKGKGSKYDRIASETGYGPILGRRRGMGDAKRSLPVSASAIKSSSFYALENDRTGKRLILSQGDGRTTHRWTDGKRTAGPAVKLDIGNGINTKNGDHWTVQRAKLDEKMKHAPVDYYQNVYATTADSVLALEHAKLGLEYFDALTKTPEWGQLATRNAQAGRERGWNQIDRAPLQGWYLAPELFEPLIDFYGGEPLVNLAGKTGTPGFTPSRLRRLVIPMGKALESVNRIATQSIFISPFPHAWNVFNHWVISRGSEWASLPGYARLLSTGSRAAYHVWNRTPLYVEMMHDGAPMFYSNARNNNLIQHIFDRLGAEMEAETDTNGPWHLLAKAFEYPSPAALLPFFYREVNRGMWYMGDVMMMQRIMELESRMRMIPSSALSREAAIKEARTHIPDYVVPPRVAGSRLLSRVLQDMTLTMFGRYRYSQYKGYFHDANKAIRLNHPKEAGAAIGRLLVTFFVATTLYDILDKYLQKIIGIPDAQMVRGGPFHIIENFQKLQEQGISGAPRFLFTTFIPSPIVTAFIQAFDNHELWRQAYGYYAPPIMDKKYDAATNLRREGESIGSSLGVGSDISRGLSGQWGPVVGQQFGVKIPYHKH